jgi:hypothetical protein
MALTESCLKNADIPNSPFFSKWQPDAVGRHDFKLKIEFGRITAATGAGIRRQAFLGGTPETSRHQFLCRQ